MQAVFVKYVPPSDSKGAAVMVSSQGIRGKRFDWVDYLDPEDNFQRALEQWLTLHKWPMDGWVGGATAKGRVFVQDDKVLPAFMDLARKVQGSGVDVQGAFRVIAKARCKSSLGLDYLDALG